MNYVFDIDGTICTNTYGKYDSASPFKERIQKINRLYDEGNSITFFTARGMNTLNANIEKVYEKYYEFTSKQLQNWGVKYHKLILGKPSADVYVDDKGINDEDYFNTNFSSQRLGI